MEAAIAAGFPCSHAGCGCRVSSPATVCGILCRDRHMVSSESEPACGCGHADCYRDSDWNLAPEFED
jgi:hypothetical protein